jgi:hypothetical protein
VATVAASKDTNLGLATLHWHNSNQVHFRATAAIRCFRRARHQHAVELRHDRPALKLHQPTGAVTGALVLKRHSHGLCASQYRLQGTKGCLPTCWRACCKPEVAVSPSEITACYRLYAACCAEIARRASDQRRKARLLNLAGVWLRLVQSVRRQTGVSGPAMPRLPTHRAEIVT